MADEVAELQLFVEIVKAGNLSAAARALNSSPAAMSRGLTALESRPGLRLVTRTSRTFELTAEGQPFYERCERIVLLDLSVTLPKMVSQESRTNLPQSTSKDVPPVTKPRRSPRPDSNRDRLH